MVGKYKVPSTHTNNPEQDRALALGLNEIGIKEQEKMLETILEAQV